MTLIVESRQNARVKLIRSLADRKGRSSAGLFFAEGIRLVVEAQRSSYPIEVVVVCRELLNSHTGWEAVDAISRTGVQKLEVSANVFRSLSTREHPSGVGVVAPIRLTELSTVDPETDVCLVALVRPQDPGNVGSVIRTCDAAGAAGLIVLGESVDPFDPRAVRASMGSVFTKAIVRATLPQLREWATATKTLVIGVSAAAETEFASFTYPRRTVLVMGSEREGLAGIDPFDASVSIPMVGSADSLNLAVATAIVLYEVLRQSTRSQKDKARPLCLSGETQV
jgi:TrmH family RNA methyltransferase